jgi:hypothetical protein
MYSLMNVSSASWFGNAVAVAVPAAILCIHRRLYYMVMAENTLVSQAEVPFVSYGQLPQRTHCVFSNVVD